MTYILLLLVVIAVAAVLLYNSLVKLRNKAKEAWADIDTQLKRRYDLIPNIVETVKGYASHEAGTLQAVTEARTKAMGAQNLQEKEQAENMLQSALKSIFALAENYPELKANQNFLQLQTTLKEIEEHVQLSRRYYNGTVRDMNTKLETFPNNLIAGPLGFDKMEFFQATDEEKQNVKVDFKEQSAGEAEAQETSVAPAPTPATPQNTPNVENIPGDEAKTEPTPITTPAPEAPAAPEMTVTPATATTSEAPVTPEATPEAPATPQTPPETPQQ